MIVVVNNEERDYSASGGLFNSGLFQDLYIMSKDKKETLARIEVSQSYLYSSDWGINHIEGRVNVKMVAREFEEWFKEKHGDFTLETVNKLFKPLDFTEEDEFREVQL